MPNNLALLKYGAPPPAQCWGATATIQEDAPLDEDDTDAPPLALSNEAAQPVRDPQPESSIDAALGNPFTSRGRINDVAPEEASDDAPLNDDVLRGIAASGGARQPEADEASLASRATSAHTVIPTPHGRARMGERAVSVKELQTAKKYGTVTRARNGRDGAVRWKIEHNGIVYITDRTQKLVITTYHQSPEEPEAKDARVRELVRQVRELSAERSEATNRLETAVAMLFIEHREEERRLEERLDALESELEDARGPRVQAAGPRDAEEKRDAAPPPAPPRAKKNSGPVAHVPSPAEILSNFTADQAREAAAREAAERAAAAAEPPPAPVPPPPMLPHPWQAFWDARSERYYFGQPTTGQVQWDMPVAAPPPPPPPVRPAYTEASYERLVAELAEVRVRPSQHALDILRRQEVTVEDLCDLTHAMLVAAGLDQPDVHMIWSKIEVLRNRQIARESC